MLTQSSILTNWENKEMKTLGVTPSPVSSTTLQQIFWEGSHSACRESIKPGAKLSDHWELAVVKGFQYQRYQSITESVHSQPQLSFLRATSAACWGQYFQNIEKMLKLHEKSNSHLDRAGLTLFGLQAQPAKHRKSDKGSFLNAV